MKRDLWVLVVVPSLPTVMFAAGAALAQKPGGVLQVAHRDSPASMSTLEEVTISTVAPMMAVFNNLVIFDQHMPQNTLQSIVPDLAAGWSWNEDGTELSFRLREDVRWHDGQPFTAKDVQCTWDMLLGKSAAKFRINPRKSWYWNLERVSTNGDNEATFHLRQPQPALLALLASGYSPVYPCHVPPQDMRRHPIGTGPFKFVEYKPNESIRLTRNPDYWKPGRPYLDGIEWTIITNRSTALLAFVAGKIDMTFPYEVTVALLKDIERQDPQAIYELRPRGVSSNLIVNSRAPPFDNPDLRRAMALTLDRKAFIDILSEGQANIGGAMLPPPEGLWGMPPDRLRSLPGYGPGVQKTARKPGKSCNGSVTGLTTRSRSRSPPETFHSIATRRSCSSTSSRKFTLPANSTLSRLPIGTQRSPAGTTWSGWRTPALRWSTTPTSNFTRATHATPTATSPDIAIVSLRSCFTGSHARPTRNDASRWSGTSTRHCSEKARGRSSSIRAARPVGIPGSKA
jgi:ABC-type transport system substrate-binding protein